MRFLILLSMFLVVFPIGAINSSKRTSLIETSHQVRELPDTFLPQINTRDSDIPDLHRRWLKLFTYNHYSDFHDQVVVVQCTCLEDDLFFDDYMGVIRSVGSKLDLAIDHVRSICENAFGGIFAETIITECYHQAVFLNSADRPPLTKVY